METTGFMNSGLAMSLAKEVKFVNFGESGESGEWGQVLAVFELPFVDF